MGLIKSNNLPPAGATFAFTDIERQAQQTLARAAQRAEQMLAEAQRQADALRERAIAEGRAAGLEQGQKEGLTKGLAQGLADGKAQATKEGSPRVAAAVGAFEQLGALVEQHVASLVNIEEDLLGLTLGIARRVVKTLAARDASVIEANVREAVRLAATKASLRIAIHPEHRAQLVGLLNELKLTWPNIQHLELVDDATLALGGCRVMTIAGEIDADVDRQIGRLLAELAPDAKVI